MGGKKLRSKGFIYAILMGVLMLSAFLTYRSVPGPAEPKSDGLPSKAKAKNLLIMGIDERRHDIGRADTIILVKINGAKKTVEGISVPRDSLVKVPGHGFTKVNHSYGYGGPELVKSVVEDTLGVKIDNYISVNFTEFENLIDRFGGVTVTVDKDLNYTDKAGDLYINIKKGTQTLDGKAALGFVRFRHDRLGDLGRMKRQQQFIDALFDKMKDPRMAVSALKTVEKTDLTVKDILALWPVARQKAQYKISMATAPGVPRRLKSGWYYILEANSKAVHELTAQGTPVSKLASNGVPAKPAMTASSTVTQDTGQAAIPANPSDTGPITVGDGGPSADGTSNMQVDITPIDDPASAAGTVSADPVPESPTSGWAPDVSETNDVM